MLSYQNTIILLIFMFINSNDAAKILGVFPVPSISHQVAFRPLMHELARRGHEVTVITPDPAFPKGQTPKNLNEIDVHDISYSIIREFIPSLGTGDRKTTMKLGKAAIEMFTRTMEKQFKTPQVQDLINNKNETFDLVLVELFVRPALVFSHLYKALVIFVSSLGGLVSAYNLVGAPTHPLLYGLPLRQKLLDLTLWDRIEELYNYYYYEYIYYKQIDSEDAMLRRLVGDDVPSVQELSKNVQILMLNIHPIWEDNRPVPPNVIYMGGVHQKPYKELPQDLKSYLDSSKHGVIYFSLGTNVIPSVLPKERIQILLNVFSKLPYDVLWKYDKDELPGLPPNVKIQKWFPQSDLLRHPKVKLFVTQGGLQSTDEAITAGVPLLAIPMLGDQWYNAERYVQFKIGVQLDLQTITEENFKNAIETVLGDDSYRQNMKKLREILTDQPQSPLERAVWWTEYVLRHGGKHLRSPAANMPWTQYYEIELVSLLFASLLAIVLLVVFALRTLWRYVFINPNSSKIKKS